MHRQAKRLTGSVTLDTGEQQLQFFRRQVRDDLARTRQNTNIGLFWFGRIATGHVRLSANPSDADTVTITLVIVNVDGGAVTTIAKVFEFDSNSSVSGTNVSVTIGGSAATTMTNLATAITANFDTMDLVGVKHGTDDAVDIATKRDGNLLTLAKSGASILIQDNAEELAADFQHVYSIARTITAEDVLRNRVRVDTGLTSITWYDFRVETDSDERMEWQHVGVVTVSGGNIELAQSGSFALEAGNVLRLIVVGVA